MIMSSQTDQEITCILLWRLARIHGWSGDIPISDLVSQAPVSDEKRAREVCRRVVVQKSYIAYDPSTGRIRIRVPHKQLAYDLRECDYGILRIETTLTRFSGFSPQNDQ